MRIFILVISILLFYSAGANALRLKNCDDEPRVVKVNYYGQVLEISLLPNQRRVLTGKAQEISTSGSTIYLSHNDAEYCVRDNKLKLQRRKHRSGNRK